MRALLYVQHLLGTGHLQRVAMIGHDLAARGVDTQIVTGGMRVPTIDLSTMTVHQLEPVRAADASFSGLVDTSGNTVTPALLTRREVALVNLAHRLRPDVVLIETWPFGRRALRGELTALVESLHRRSIRPQIVCSIRDILQRGRKPKRLDETVTLVARWFDKVLVHSDPGFVSLEHSFERADAIANKVQYTGFIVRPELLAAPELGDDGSGEILVSAGGGAVGAALYAAAIGAARSVRSHRWRVLVGRNLTESAFADLKDSAPEHMTVEWARPDFPALLRRAALSVSQAGYNTVMELLVADCPMVIVPFEEHGETEQGDRARRLAELGLAHVIHLERLTPETLGKTVVDALKELRPATPLPDVDGVRETARILAG